MDFKGVLLVLLLSCCLASCLKCSPEQVRRPVPTPNGVIINCCQRLPHTACPPGTEIQPCNKTSDPEWCKPCDVGLVQDHYSGTGNERPCIRPDVICPPEEDLVLVNGIQECQCRAAEGYCGKSRDCLKVEKSCPEGFQLHHTDCDCTQIVTETTRSMSVTSITTPPKLSTMSVPSSMDPLSTPTSQQMEISIQQKETKTGIEMLADEPPPLHAEKGQEVVNSKGLTSTPSHSTAARPPTPSATDSWLFGILAAVLLLILILLLVFVAVMVKMKRKHTFYRPTMCCNWCSYNTIEGPDVERGEKVAPPEELLDPFSMATPENPVTMKALEETRGAEAEEGSLGEAPDQTWLKQPNGSFCQPLNPRTSPEIIGSDPAVC